MTTALCRINGGEVIKISLVNQPFDGPSEFLDYFTVLTDPTLTNGSEVRENLGNGLLGPMRELGYAKIAIIGTNTIRNATQGEIDNFAVAQAQDRASMDATQADKYIDEHPVFRKAFKAFLKLLIARLNSTNNRLNDAIDQINGIKSGIDASTTLAQIKTAVAALPVIESDLPQSTTLQQAITALKNEILPDD